MYGNFQGTFILWKASVKDFHFSLTKLNALCFLEHCFFENEYFTVEKCTVRSAKFMSYLADAINQHFCIAW